MTKVVNVKVKYIRSEGYANLKEWMEDEENVYIGRGGVVFIEKERFPKRGSKFLNPFKIGRDGNRDEVLQKYKIYICDKLKEDKKLMDELNKMKGKKIGCWCCPEKCHGDILVEIIETINEI